MRRLRENKIDNAEYYEKIWAAEFNQRPYYDAVRMRALIKPVQHGHLVIDVGAGVFGACQYIAERTNLECQLMAIDQSYTAKEIVNKVAPQIEYLLGEFENKLPFDDNTFDVVIAGEIVEHMHNPAAFCAELARICKVNGTVALSTVDTECENAKKHGEYPEHLWEFTSLDLLSFFSPYGKASYELVGDYHFIYLQKK